MARNWTFDLDIHRMRNSNSRLEGTWETGPLARPLGRGINFMIYVEGLDPLLDALAAANWPLLKSPEESCYSVGEQEIVQREFLVQDPDGYLLRFAEALSPG